MTEATINMSMTELERLDVVKRVKNKELKRGLGAKLLGISPRHMSRLVSAYIAQGPRALISKHRGKVSNRARSVSFKQQVIDVVRMNYADFTPTFASEKLRERDGLVINRETLRQWMIEAELWQAKGRRVCRIHQQRPRRSQRGELVQIDGSPHDWFEGRGERCCLLVFIDDATSELLALHFEPTETTAGYFKTARKHIAAHGLALAYYSDKHSIFRVPVKEAETGTGESQFGRAMRELGVTLICANSPQAKGRVEKANSTLQDRLVKELRLRHISDIDSANAYLPEFMADYNRRFAKPPANPVDAHRKTVPKDESLDLIFTHQCTRQLSKNLELSYQNKIYQIQTNTPCYTMRHAKVTVCDDLCGSISLLYKNQLLSYRVFDKNNQRQPVVPAKQLEPHIRKGHKPHKNHPWRQYDNIKRPQTSTQKIAAGGLK